MFGNGPILFLVPIPFFAVGHSAAVPPTSRRSLEDTSMIQVPRKSISDFVLPPFPNRRRCYCLGWAGWFLERKTPSEKRKGIESPLAIKEVRLDSRLRGNDNFTTETVVLRFENARAMSAGIFWCGRNGQSDFGLKIVSPRFV